MSFEWIVLIAFAFVVGSVGCGLIVAGYMWGRFAALTALQKGSAKWKGYSLALAPSLFFTLTIAVREPFLSPHLVFLWLAVPATIGTGVRFRRIE